MNRDIIRHIILLFVFVAVQALVLGHIHLFECATPMLYVYFVLLFPRSFPRWLSLSMCFVLGLSVDAFFNTPGVGTASMTLAGFMQPYILSLFLDREDADDFNPSIHSMGWMKYITYGTILVGIFCVVFFALEAFNFFNWIQWLLCVGGSFLLTFLLILTIDYARSK